MALALQNIGAARVLLSQWAIRSQWTARELYDYVLGFLDGNDRLLVCEITANWVSTSNALINLNNI